MKFAISICLRSAKNFAFNLAIRYKIIIDFSIQFALIEKEKLTSHRQNNFRTGSTYIFRFFVLQFAQKYNHHLISFE